MRVISWNCRGLVRGPAIRAIRSMIHSMDLAAIFLMETKMEDVRLESTLRSLGFLHFVSCPPVGLRGGLALCWRPNICIHVLSISRFVISVRVNPGFDLPAFCASLYTGLRVGRIKFLFGDLFSSL